jgi:hypothetical protein
MEQLLEIVVCKETLSYLSNEIYEFCSELSHGPERVEYIEQLRASAESLLTKIDEEQIRQIQSLCAGESLADDEKLLRGKEILQVEEYRINDPEFPKLCDYVARKDFDILYQPMAQDVFSQWIIGRVSSSIYQKHFGPQSNLKNFHHERNRISPRFDAKKKNLGSKVFSFSILSLLWNRCQTFFFVGNKHISRGTEKTIEIIFFSSYSSFF